MPTRALARFAGLTCTFALMAGVAQAQPRTVIAVDPADKAAAFGAADLSDAIARWRVPVTVVAPAQIARESAPTRRRGHDRGGEAAGPAGRQRTGAAGLRDPPRHRRRDHALVGDRSRPGRRDVRGARARRGGAHRWTPGPRRRSPGEPVHRPARHQVQHPARRAHAQLLRRLDVRPGQHPRDVGHGVLDALPRRDGAAPLQRPLAVEPQPVPVAGEGAGVPEGGARRRQAQDRRDVRRDQSGPRHVRPVLAARDGQGDDHRREDRLLARRHGVRPRSRHRRQRLHLEHLRLRHRGQRLRPHRRSAQRGDEGLRPPIHARAVRHLPAAHGDRRHLRREHGRPRRRRQGAVDVGDLRPRREGRDGRRRRSGQPVPSSRPAHHADPSRPPGRSQGHRRDVQGAARQRSEWRRLHAGVQLQVLAGAHAQLDGAEASSSRTAGTTRCRRASRRG